MSEPEKPTDPRDEAEKLDVLKPNDGSIVHRGEIADNTQTQSKEEEERYDAG